MMRAMQVIVFLMGCVAIHRAVEFYCFFYRSNRGISKAMRWFLVEQIVSASGVMFFSMHSLFGAVTGEPQGEWNAVTPFSATIVRTVMFWIMIHSTTRLSVEVQRILNSQDGQLR